MPLISCPSCGHRVSEDAPECPACHFAVASHLQQPVIPPPAPAPVTAEKPPQSSAETLGGCVIIIVALLACGGGLTWCMDGDDKPAARQMTPEEQENAARYEEEVKRRQAIQAVEDAKAAEVQKQVWLESKPETEKAVQDLEDALKEDKNFKDIEKKQEAAQTLLDQHQSPIAVLPGRDELQARVTALKGLYHAAAGKEAVRKKEWSVAMESFKLATRAGAMGESQADDFDRARFESAKDLYRLGRKSEKDEPEQALTHYEAGKKLLEFIQGKLKEGGAHKREMRKFEKQIIKVQARILADKLYHDFCGPRPQPDAWDAGLSVVERYVERGAHDSGSIDTEQCKVHGLYEEDCWKVSCHVTGKNAFGAQVRNVGVFWVSSKGVIKSEM